MAIGELLGSGAPRVTGAVASVQVAIVPASPVGSGCGTVPDRHAVGSPDRPSDRSWASRPGTMDAPSASRGCPPRHDRPRPRRSRGIDPDAPQYNARLIRREDETDSLAYFWVRFDGDATPFEPGQYMTIGVMRRRQDRAAAVLRGVAAGRRRERRLRVLHPARPGRAVHAVLCATCRSATGCG